jgi:ADP-ribose pyrophosphatase YjhB (NUDIX family)
MIITIDAFCAIIKNRMTGQNIKVRVRLVIIKEGKILLSYTQTEDFYFYIGGKVEFGETLQEAAVREVAEECGGAVFTFKKILYIRDFILPEGSEHSVEFYILGDIDKFVEIEGLKDEEFGGKHWQTWVPLDKLAETNVLPGSLTSMLLADYQKNFEQETRYLGKIA